MSNGKDTYWRGVRIATMTEQELRKTVFEMVEYIERQNQERLRETERAVELLGSVRRARFSTRS